MSANIDNGSVVEPVPALTRAGLSNLPVNTTPRTTTSSKAAAKGNPKDIPPPPPLPDLTRKRFAPTQLGTINNLNSRRSRSGSRSGSPSDVGIVTATTVAPTISRPSLTATGSFNRPPRPSLDDGLATPLYANTTSLAPAFQRTLSPLKMAMPNSATSFNLQDSQSLVGQYGGPLALSFSDTFMMDRPVASSFRGGPDTSSSHSPDQPQLMGGYVKRLMPLPQTSDREDSSPYMDAPPPPPRAAHHVLRSSSSSNSWATDDHSDPHENNNYDSPDAQVEGPGTPPPAQRYPSEPGAASRVLDKYHFMKTFTVQPKTPGSMDKKLRRLMVEPSVRNPQMCLVRRATRAPETPPKQKEETSPTFKRHARYRFRNSLSPAKQNPKQQGGGATPLRVPPSEAAVEAIHEEGSSFFSDSSETNQAPPLAVEAADSALFNPPPPTSTQPSFDGCEDDDSNDFLSLRRIEPLPSQLEEGIKERIVEGISQQMPTMSRALVDGDDFEAKPPQPTSATFVHPADEAMEYNDYKYLKPLTPARVPPPPSATVSSSAPQPAIGNPRRLGSLTSLRPVLIDTTSAQSTANNSGMTGYGGAVLGRRRVVPAPTRNIAPLPVVPANNPSTLALVPVTVTSTAPTSSPLENEMALFVHEASGVQQRRLVASCEVHARYILSLQRDLMMHHFVESFIQEVNRINAQIDSNTLSLGWWWRQVTGANDEADIQRRRQKARASPYGASSDDNVELRAKCWYIPQSWQGHPSAVSSSEQPPHHPQDRLNVFENEWGTLDDDSVMECDKVAPTPERALFNFASF